MLKNSFLNKAIKKACKRLNKSIKKDILYDKPGDDVGVPFGASVIEEIYSLDFLKAINPDKYLYPIWTKECIKRKYGKHPAIYLDKWTPHSPRMMDYLPRCKRDLDVYDDWLNDIRKGFEDNINEHPEFKKNKVKLKVSKVIEELAR